MLRIGSALLLVGLWTAPLAADEPVDIDVDAAVDLELQIETDAVVGDEVGVDFDKTLEFTADGEVCVELVDPIPEDLMILTFSSEPVDGDVSGEEHTDHVCEFVDDQCTDPDCIWMRTRTLDDEFVADGDEVLMFMSGVADNDMSIQTFGGAPMVEMATVNTAAFDASLGLVRESALQPAAVVGLETTAAATVQTGLVGEVFSPVVEANVVTDADRDYASRLASIDELRDRALTTGDATLLQKADRMEAELKANARTGFSFFGN